MRKGYAFSVEVIASILLLFVMLSLYLFVTQEQRVEHPEYSKKVKIFKQLETLDSVGILRNCSYSLNTTYIENNLELVGYRLSVVLLNFSGNATKYPSFNDSNEIFSVSYFVCCQKDVYGPMEVRVYAEKK